MSNEETCSSSVTSFQRALETRSIDDSFGVPMICQCEIYGLISHSILFEQVEALASSAVRAALKSQAALIIVFTVSGRTARLVAKYRPSQPILAVSSI